MIFFFLTRLENENSTKVNGSSGENQGPNSFIGMNGSSDGFGNQNDPFSSNKAKDTFASGEGDPFTNFDGRTISSGFSSDPFAAKGKQDSYDPFGDNKKSEKPAMETVSFSLYTINIFILIIININNY